MLKCLSFIPLLLLIGACSDDISISNHTFIEKRDIGIDFANNLTYTESFNPYLYRNFYNGGGVACGDVNNDGLIDIYFTGNQVDNKLYLNQGNWKFKDITIEAGVECANVWCTGANMVDINADGLLDIYVCKGGDPEGPRRNNELFINNGDLTFTERAADYGLDITGLSIQSAFLDYDKDGDLDCYLLNNSTKPIGGGLDLKKSSRNKSSSDGNKFFRNDNGLFVDVAREVGIYNSDIGFGLGITISDFNVDGWPDIYISNDFFEKDYLYINQKDGTFSEQSEDYLDCMSMGAMGADAADLDNDLYPDLMVTEMMPRSLARKKTKAVYESWKKYSLSTKQGYYHQFPRNTLQRNLNGQGFAEIGRRAGVDATDWSWSCLMQDFDNDGWKDIFITNGIYKDLLDRDYLGFIANKEKVNSMIRQGGEVITQLIDSMPSSPLSNHMFTHHGDMVFTDMADSWGLNKKGYSNGCAYADLDNDGDLDLVINNVNAAASIYENGTHKNHYIDIDLSMTGKNRFAIGTKVTLYQGNKTYIQELYPSRGFQSSVPYRLHYGLGNKSQTIDSIHISWPDNISESFYDLQVDSIYKIRQGDGHFRVHNKSKNTITFEIDTLYSFTKNIYFNQFDRDKLLHRMNPITSPIIRQIPNTEGLFFVGAAKNHTSFVGKLEDNYLQVIQKFESTKMSEINDVAFFDLEGDGDLDIYLGCGGSSYSKYSPALNDIVLENTNGIYTVSSVKLEFPYVVSTSAVEAIDWNNNGLMDILIADSKNHYPYGNKGSVHVLLNQGDKSFVAHQDPALQNLGHISDMALLDIGADSSMDLIVVGEWMGIKIFNLDSEIAIDQSQSMGMSHTIGMWSHLNTGDFNLDGIDDFFVGNCGTNSGIDQNTALLINDFDNNGKLDPIICHQNGNNLIPLLDKEDMTSVFPYLNKRYLKYEAYANATIKEIFGGDKILASETILLQNLESELYLNSKDGLTKQDLPQETQYSSVYTSIFKSNSNSKNDIVIGGNHHKIKPQYGREEASRIWNMNNNGSSINISSMGISGEIRSMIDIGDGFIFTTTDGLILKVHQNEK